MNIKALIKNPKAYIKVANHKLVRLLRTYKYRGTKVLCDCCKWNGKQFFTHGECPNCKSLPRTRLIPFSIDFFNLAQDKLKVMHVAPNTIECLSVKSKLKTEIQYDTMDIKTDRGFDLVQDLTQMTINDDIYDLAIIWHVFEHIVEDTKAISEVFRVLKPGGNLLMSVPIYPINNLRTFEDKNIPYNQYKIKHGKDDHCRSCGLDYYKRFEDVGFKTRELKVENVSNKQVLKYGLSKSHVVWCFTK